MLRGVWTVLATLFTLAVIGLSMAMNFSFGYALGTTPWNARILASLSVACDGLKAVLPLFIAWQWADRRWLASAAGALLFFMLFAYGLTSAIGFAAENRAIWSGQRDTRNAALEVSLSDLKSAEARLAALPPHRILGVIEADIAALNKDRLWDATHGCKEATLAASRSFCKQLDLLAGELALARERAALSSDVASIRSKVAQSRSAGAGAIADPQAQAITTFTGIDVPLVRSALTWLLAFAVEAISAFGLFAISWRRREHPAEPLIEVEPAYRLAGVHGDDQQLSNDASSSGWRLLKAG